jgi:hypothetical protein
MLTRSRKASELKTDLRDFTDLKSFTRIKKPGLTAALESKQGRVVHATMKRPPKEDISMAKPTKPLILSINRKPGLGDAIEKDPLRTRHAH